MNKIKLSGTISSKSKSLFNLPKTEYNLETYDLSLKKCSKINFFAYKD